MIGKKITTFAFTTLTILIILSIALRIKEYFALSNIMFSLSILIFLLFVWMQRKIKEDMLPFLTDEYKKREWRYYFSSLIAFILLIFATFLNIFIVFFELPISRIFINLLLGIVILLMLYTVFSIPNVEKTIIYPIFLLFSFIFSMIVIASQLDIGYHLPENISPFVYRMADPLFIINMAIISCMASLIAGGEMPSPTEAIIGMHERGKRIREEIILRKNIFYFIIVALISLYILINLATMIGMPKKIEISKFEWGYALIFLSIAILITVVIYIVFILPEKAGKIKEKYDIEKLYATIILASSAFIAGIFILIAILLQIGKLSYIGPIHLSKKNAIDFAIFAILTLIGPFGLYEYRRYRKIDLIEERFPDFLRDLAESRKAGMTMAKAVEMAAKGDYGYLTPEIKKMAVQISWGLSFSEALRRFGERIKTPLVKRTTAMVVKASEAGGKVADVIEAAAKNVREIKILQSERRTEMKMYLMIIYISFFVFLAVVVALASMFLPKLLEASQTAGTLVGGGARISLDEYKFIYICTALSQAIGNGIVAGSLSEGRALAGLRHGTIMILITYVVFKLLL